MQGELNMHAHSPLGTMVRFRFAAAALLAVALVAPARWLAAAELSADTKAAVDAAVEKFMKEKRVPGLSAAIVVDHELCYERGYGMADVENEVPATSETIYRLASISKMLTATAVMQLVEQGKLDLEAPIQKYVAFPEKQAPITCELLLKHQSGIRHYKDDEVRSNVAYAHVTDAYGVFKDDPLLFAPGEKMSYSTYGFNVLGGAIEGASGESYVAYVQEHIARPAGMKTIRADSPYKIIPHRAAGYRLSGPALVNDIHVDVSNKIPGGGWCCSAGDLARFAIALCQDKLVSQETLERTWTPQKTSKGVQTPAGYHGGGQPKVSTFLTFSPAQKTAVAVMCNLRNAPVGSLADELMEIAAR
jgi:serine beta-lactamase-like protein LACTB, mitochondrial